MKRRLGSIAQVMRNHAREEIDMNASNRHTRHRQHRLAATVAAVVLGLGAGHAQAHDGEGHYEEAPLSAQDRQDLADVRSLTAIYHDFANAEADGWRKSSYLAVPPSEDNPCLQGPKGEGDMGLHYVNLRPDSLNNIGATLGATPNLDPRYPNVLVYEPLEDGSQRLVAVEYIIPFDLWPDTNEAPELFGQKFRRLYSTNGIAYNLWELHVWLWRNNPNGMFYEWNPKVSCQYAAQVS